VLFAAAAQNGKTHKAILPKGQEIPGMTLWQDYGSFALYRVSDQAFSSLSLDDRMESDEMDRILMDAYPFDTQTDILYLPAELQVGNPTGYTLQLVQFVGPIKNEWLAAIEAAGGQPVHYIANNAYLVWASDQTRNQLNTMATQGDFLQYSAPFQPYFKLGPSLIERLNNESEPEEILPVVIQMVRHEGQETSEGIIKGLSIKFASEWQPVLAFQNIQTYLRAGDITKVASLPDVVWVGERFERTLFDEVQGQILAGNFDSSQSGPTGPGYLDWLVSLGFSQIPGDYPIIDITDDGIGNGTTDTGDPTFHKYGNASDATRLAYLINCTSASNGGSPDGHGHINASIAGGYDTRSGSPYRDGEGFNLGIGINPYGRLAGTRVFTSSYDTSKCGSTDAALIKKEYISGARISSNSWGCSDCASSYDESSQAYDAGARDANPDISGNQGQIFVFAAGNSGRSGASTVGTPGNAKNVITVGASENDRPTWTDACAIAPAGANNAMDIIDFSSRGPAPGDRIKPDIVAPGTHIQGTASTYPGYNGSGVCDKYHPNGQTVFAASSGTSHSTPAIAGVASLEYYWLQNHYQLANPSPAIIKAYLVTHTLYLTGVDANDTLPSNNQGYGMPIMSMAFDGTPRYLIDQTYSFNNSGESWTFEGTVADPAKPVRVVLAYTDQAGAIGTSPQVNDLNLRVDIGGSVYLGNHFSGNSSITGGTPDSKNNVEAVFLPGGKSGGIVITVTGFNIAGDGVPGAGDATDQDFALVCYNCAQFPDFTVSAVPTNQEICTDSTDQAVYDVSIGQILGYNQPVILSASGQPAGTTASFSKNAVTPPGSSILTITNLTGALAGEYPLAIRGDASNGGHTVTVHLELFDRKPAQPTLLTPSNGASDQPVRPTFTWADAIQAVSYTIEIATDDSFRRDWLEPFRDLRHLDVIRSNYSQQFNRFFRAGCILSE
jgi:hypothetical protein